MVAEVVNNAVAMGMGGELGATTGSQQCLFLGEKRQHVGHNGQFRLVCIKHYFLLCPYVYMTCINQTFSSNTIICITHRWVYENCDHNHDYSVDSYQNERQLETQECCFPFISRHGQ